MPIDVGAAAAGAGVGAGVGTAIFPGVGTAIGAGIGFLAPIIAGMIGEALASGDKEKARKLMDDAVAQFGPDVLKAPEIAELTPHLGPSRFETAQADPQAVESQRRALAGLERASGPDNLEFRAAMNDAEFAANQQAGGQQGAIEQSMDARGMGNSGTAFALKQQAGQDAANRSASMGFNAAAEGRRQALQALSQSGGLASSIRGQSWNEQSDRSRAADEINRMNEMGRVGAVQQGFTNNLNLATARSNTYTNAANVAQGNAAQTQQNFANIGAGVGQAAGGVGQYINEEEARKQRGGK